MYSINLITRVTYYKQNKPKKEKAEMLFKTHELKSVQTGAGSEREGQHSGIFLN